MPEEWPQAATIPEALAWWAERTPTAPALLAPRWGELDYAGLQGAVEGLVADVHGLGVAAGEMVLVTLPDGPALATMLLAGMSAGVVAPLSWEMTRHELAQVMSSGRARCVVLPAATPTPAREAAAETGTPVFELNAAPPASRVPYRLSGARIAAPAAANRRYPDDVALVVHSSGTTAQPKRVPRTHGNIVTSASVVQEFLELSPRDRYLCLAPLAYSQANNALFSNIWAGCSFVASPGPQLAALPGWLRAYRPTWFSATPTLLRALIANEAAVVALRRWPPRLIRVGAGGLLNGESDRVEAILGTRVITGYGMSEAATVAAERVGAFRRKPGSTGRLNCDVAIIGDGGDMLARGETGEIVVRGPQVFPGYLDDAEANATAFLPEGWFRTGDMGRLDDEGYLYVTGRLKELINRGGMMISPREIEEALLSAPAVAEACVFGLPHPFLGEEVAAAVVLRPGVVSTRRALRAHVARRLSAVKVPHTIAFVEAIPKGPTGKALRREMVGIVGEMVSHPGQESRSPEPG